MRGEGGDRTESSAEGLHRSSPEGERTVPPVQPGRHTP